MPYVVVKQQASRLQGLLTPRGPLAERWRLHSVRVGGTRVHAFYVREGDGDAILELQLHHPEAPGVRAVARSEHFLLVTGAPALGELAGALAPAMRGEPLAACWTWVDACEDWLRVPVPAWMRRWPLGLRPILIQVHDGLVELTYPGRLRVTVQARPTLRALAGVRSPATTTLCQALRLRLRDDAEARRWLARVSAARPSPPLLELQRASGSRSWSAAREDAAARAWLDLALRRVASALSYRPGSDAAAPPGPAPPRRCSPASAVVGATRWRALGRSPRAVDARHLLACGALLLLLEDPEAAYRPLAFAYHHAGLGAPRCSRPRPRPGARATSSKLARRARADGSLDPALLVALADALTEVDALAQLEGLLRDLIDKTSEDDPLRAPATARLAELCLYRGRVDEAESRALAAARGGPLSPALRRVLIGADVLRGRYAQALAHAERARADGEAEDPQLPVWLAEARLRLGDPLEARREALRAPLASNIAVHLIEGLAELELGGLRDDNIAVFPAVVRAVLDLPEETDGCARAELGQRALARLGGSRGAPLTRLRPDGALERHATLSPRARFEALQRELLRRPAEEVLAEFERLRARHRDLPYPLTYGAELMLWLGHYERAQAWLEEAWARFETRWGYVGAGAAAYLRGEPARALEWWERGAARFGLLAAEATHAYRGELWCVTGETDRAIEALEHAVTQRPTRVGSWIFLARAYLDRGRADERVTAILDTLGALAPALVWEACLAVGRAPQVTLEPASARAPLERAAAMLRGNRSSRLLTFFDAEPRLRVFDERHRERFLACARDGVALALDARVHEALGL
ncbi:MAG: hypothetical protein H6713_30310 [Myxococcales bacterium]|nr:hypothetical protein [Myxococcales bacterium]